MLKRLFGKKADPIAYRLPLDWFEQQLPHDLLSTEFHWVWESSRGFPAPHSTLPEQRHPTILTAGNATTFSEEIGEYYLEAHREMTVFASAAPMELATPQLYAAIKTFAKSGEGPLVAIIYQPPQGAAEMFLPRTPQPQLARVLITWSARLGQPIQQSPGGPMLKRLFLKTPEAISGFPPLASPLLGSKDTARA